MSRIIALSGSAAVGKTTIAKLAAALGRSVRHCGEAAHTAAAELSVPIHGIPLATHREIDNKTQEFARENPGAIIEGRYLAYHLFDDDVDHYCLTADFETRAQRLASRLSVEMPLAREFLQREDDEDDSLVALLYDKRSCAVPVLVDTSCSTPSETLAALLDRAR